MHEYNDCSLPPGQGSVYKADMRINEKKKVKSMRIFLSNQKSEFKCGSVEGFICLKYLSSIPFYLHEKVLLVKHAKSSLRI